MILADGPVCSECIVKTDTADASEIADLISGCLTVLPIPTPTSCVSAYSVYSQAFTACHSDPLCICPTVLTDGPICSKCVQPTHPAQASLIGDFISGCQTFTPAPTACSSACSAFTNAFSVCHDVTCLCSTVLADGPLCSECVASTDQSQASVLSEFITGCLSLTQTGTGTGMSTVLFLSKGRREVRDSFSTIVLYTFTFISVVACFLCVYG